MTHTFLFHYEPTRFVVANQGLKSINIYDVFANIVPGVTFLLGMFVAIDTAAVISTVLGEGVELSLGIAVLLVFVAVAFVLGQVIQAVAGRFDGDHGFPALVRQIREGNADDVPIEISEFGDAFWELCRDYFVLTDGFESYDRLFKAVLAFLENRGRSRALRMQALYLFGRGMFVTAIGLTFVYSVTAISLQYGFVSTDLEPFVRSYEITAGGAVVAALAIYAFSKVREELESDWIKYAVVEFYLELVEPDTG